jgi:uncharacterized DUF497 family protein
VQLTELLWTRENVNHILRHRVTPEEVEEVCFSRSPRIERGRDDLYYVTGQTGQGRYLFVVMRYKGRGKAKVITARDMDDREKARYKRR